MSAGRKLRVGVFFGGRSVEHEVSLRSARTVLDALDPSRFEAVPVGVTRDGRWWSGGAAERLLAGEAVGKGPGPRLPVPDPAFGGLAGPDATGAWETEPLDVVFPLIHGGHGEDGTLQGLLELAGLPYVGSGVVASALGMDKRMQRRLFRAAGLPVLPTLAVEWVRWESDAAAERQRILDEIGLPCFVKPASSGSSVGVGKVKRLQELDRHLEEAARYDTMILVEPARDVRELECAVLGNHEPRATVPGEIKPGREFYDYRAKYLEDTSTLHIPADVPEELSSRARNMAEDAFRTLGCEGLARVDFFLDRSDGSLWINEINTLPGFTSISMYPRLWAHEGLPLPGLVARLIDLGLQSHAEKSRNRQNLPEPSR